MKAMGLFIKYCFDFILALIVSILSFPIILIVLIIVKCKSPEAPAIFKQKRVGRNGKLFTIYKIRTMTNEKDENGELLSDELRLKRWGKVIRKINIDELPQAWNILKGEMSWIGPRPLLEKEMIVMSTEEQKLRQSVRPGITGWEAVNEEKSDSRKEMAQYDLNYVKKWSYWLDIKIFFKTVYIVLFGRRPSDEYRAPKLNKDIENNGDNNK